MSVQCPLSERRGAEEPPWHCRDTVMAMAVPPLGTRLTYQTKVAKSRSRSFSDSLLAGKMEHGLPAPGIKRWVLNRP